MAIHALRWNLFHENVFASCGADWTVKIWDHMKKYVKLNGLCLFFVLGLCYSTTTDRF